MTAPAKPEMSRTMNRLPTPMFQASVRTPGPARSAIRRARGSCPGPSGRRGRRADAACSVQRPTLRWQAQGSRVHKGTLSSPPMARKSTPRTVRAPRVAADFRRRLLRWFRRHGRDLPWRRTRDPVSRHRLGVHAPADAGLEGAGLLPALPRAVPYRWTHWPPRAGGDGPGKLGGTGVLPPRREPPPARAGRRAGPRRA